MKPACNNVIIAIFVKHWDHCMSYHVNANLCFVTMVTDEMDSSFAVELLAYLYIACTVYRLDKSKTSLMLPQFLQLNKQTMNTCLFIALYRPSL